MAQSAQEKARENRVRRFAVRQRYTLVKSRIRDPRAWSYGRYWLIAHDHDEEGIIVVGAERGKGHVAGDPPGLTLDEAEQWLISGD